MCASPAPLRRHRRKLAIIHHTALNIKCVPILSTLNHLITPSGTLLSRRLRGANPASFFPRSYDLSDACGRRAFEVAFRSTAAASLLRRLLADGCFSATGDHDLQKEGVKQQYHHIFPATTGCFSATGLS